MCVNSITGGASSMVFNSKSPFQFFLKRTTINLFFYSHNIPYHQKIINRDGPNNCCLLLCNDVCKTVIYYGISREKKKKVLYCINHIIVQGARISIGVVW